jgi:hypothetical protein
LNNMKYLGAMLDAQRRPATKLGQRIASSWQKWNMFMLFWSMHEIPLRVRTIVSTAIICNAVLAALEAFVLDGPQNDMLMKFTCRSVDANGKHVAISNALVFIALRIFLAMLSFGLGESHGLSKPSNTPRRQEAH